MRFEGLIIGVIAFLIIGLFHPIVIKGKYYFTEKIWPLFLLVGIAALAILSLNFQLFAAFFAPENAVIVENIEKLTMPYIL